MKCLNPIIVRGQLFGCGKCLACRANKVNEHIFRSNQEIKDSIVTYFITFTCDSEKVPLPNFGYTKEDGMRLIHKIKDKIACNYTLVYEYGGRFNRPHFHANIYCKESVTWSEMLKVCENAWHNGNIFIKEVTDKENFYVAKWHVTCTLFEDIYRIKGTDYYINKAIYDDIQKGNFNRFKVGHNVYYKPKETDEFLKQFPTFRLTSKGIGKGFLSSVQFQQQLKNGQYYMINNKGQKNYLPRYYRSKLSSNLQSECDKTLHDMFINREKDEIDRLADKLQKNGYSRRKAYKEACFLNGSVWYRNYKKNVINTKLHGNEKNNF